MRTHIRTWALVTDGMRARILRNVEEQTPPEPIEMQSAASSTRLRDILSDAPGRSFSSDGSGRRSTMEPGSDPVLHEIQVFAREVVKVLDAHRQDGSLARLAIFAAPRMLGILRQEMPEALHAITVLESPLNLAGLPAPKLYGRVREALRT